MQNRYAGDVGDFGKIGLLRNLSICNLKIGINWYLVFGEVYNDDGKHTGYLCDSKFVGCDDELLGKLGCMVYSNQRSISSIESMNLVANAVYYNEELLSPQTGGVTFRHQWHENALKKLKNTDIVFLDPDNGLLPKSVAQGSRKSIKYILKQEIIDYYWAGHSVIFYNHRCRIDEDAYLNRFQTFFHCEGLCNACSFGMKYVRGTVRDYFFLVHSEHLKPTKGAIGYILNSKWNKHFKYLSLD